MPDKLRVTLVVGEVARVTIQGEATRAIVREHSDAAGQVAHARREVEQVGDGVVFEVPFGFGSGHATKHSGVIVADVLRCVDHEPPEHFDEVVHHVVEAPRQEQRARGSRLLPRPRQDAREGFEGVSLRDVERKA